MPVVGGELEVGSVGRGGTVLASMDEGVMWVVEIGAEGVMWVVEIGAEGWVASAA